MGSTPASAVEQVHELRRRELIVAAVAEQVESVIVRVRSIAAEDDWRGPAARVFSAAVERRLHGLAAARRSLDVAGRALVGARYRAEERATAAALVPAGGGDG